MDEEFNENKEISEMIGKDHTQENFPVLSLVPESMRPQVLDFYNFARECDDIADDPSLSAEEKIDLLKGKTTYNKYLNQLLQAFMRDAQGFEYKTWQDLIDYCNISANPVGRYILSLYEEEADSDGLCTVLQITNHLQDAKKDYASLNRVYIPKDFFEKYGTDSSELDNDESSSNFKSIVEDVVYILRIMLKEAEKLPQQIKSRRLRTQVCIIISLTNIMLKRIENGDILAEEIKLTNWDRFFAVVSGFIKGL
jgi:phytoene/squalene synthetase